MVHEEWISKEELVVVVCVHVRAWFVCDWLHSGGTRSIQGEVVKVCDECSSITRSEGERLNRVHQSPPLEAEGNSQGKHKLDSHQAQQQRTHKVTHVLYACAHTCTHLTEF